MCLLIIEEEVVTTDSIFSLWAGNASVTASLSIVDGRVYLNLANLFGSSGICLPMMSQPPQQAAPSAPDSPALVVTSNVQKYAIKKKKVLSAEDNELFELTQAAGITVDQEVFK